MGGCYRFDRDTGVPVQLRARLLRRGTITHGLRKWLPALGLGLAVIALALSASCDGKEKVENVRGIVVEVVGRNLLEVETLQVRSQDGKTWTFTTDGPMPFTASHLREHQLFGQTVLVFFIKRDGRLVAVDFAD